MPKKSVDVIEVDQIEESMPSNNPTNVEADKLSNMLASVLHYISDDEVEEIDIDYILNKTEGLRDWWNSYKEKNRKHLEEEIKNSLEGLSLEDLEKIREQIVESKKEIH